MSGKYILDDAGSPVQVANIIEWGRWFEKADRHVANDTIGDVQVSTVFLGIDHNFFGGGDPILWETMVFGGPLDEEQDRYTSRAAAVAGHAAMLDRVRALKTEAPAAT